MAAVTNYHKLSGLRQHRFTIVQFWRSEVQNGSPWTKFKVSAGLCFLSKQGRILTLLFGASEAACIPWFMAPFSLFKASNSGLNSPQELTLTSSSAPLLYFKWLSWLHWAHPNNPFSMRSVTGNLNSIWNLNSPLLYNMHIHRFQGLGHGHLWGMIILSAIPGYL